MTKFTVLLLLVLVSMHCSAPKKSVIIMPKVSDEVLVSYTKDVEPIMVKYCTPCHFPETGKKKLLNTYTSTRDNIADIVSRVQLPQSDLKFMPYKLKKEPLSDSLITILKKWGKTGFTE